ncbi:MAG: TIGR04283 family arsenosugar biosynthesis glycosyltransferase [Patescibacteria group bacterium]
MASEKKKPEFSIIVPVKNEQDGIQTFLRHLKDISSGEAVEFIVVDADPAGGTINEIRSSDVVKLLSPGGRGAQMNRGAQAAGGNILLFLHADTFLPRNALVHIKNALTDDAYVGGAFDLGIDSDHFLLTLTAWCASLKHRMTRVPYGDQAIFIRSDFFRDVGGYREVPFFEDVELMRRIRRLKKRITIIRHRTRTSPRKWEKEGALYTILRNWTLEILYLLGASPEFLVKYYYRN